MIIFCSSFCGKLTRKNNLNLPLQKVPEAKNMEKMVRKWLSQWIGRWHSIASGCCDATFSPKHLSIYRVGAWATPNKNESTLCCISSQKLYICKTCLKKNKLYRNSLVDPISRMHIIYNMIHIIHIYVYIYISFTHKSWMYVIM